MRGFELFAGAGGLAMGAHKAGFEHEAVVEWNSNACATLRKNQMAGHPCARGWPIIEADVREIDYSGIADVDLLTGGPPCQPFSLGGKHRAHEDERDMFAEVFRAARALNPKAIVVENVKGLTRRSFARYFAYLELQLQYPALARRKDEAWESHRSRLEQHHTSRRRYSGLRYNVTHRVLNAADYGAPQQRHRVFFVAFRSDLDAEWSFPNASHGRDSLLRDQWLTGEYWERHGVASNRRGQIPTRLQRRVAELRESETGVTPAKAWKTVRDALEGLPNPRTEKRKNVMNHAYQAGARSYPGHTGSRFDEPAKTLKAGVHGVPGGENMLAHLNGTVRYFTVRECARLQTFPDDFEFIGSWSTVMKQLGNAVPVSLAEAVFRSVREHLERAQAV